MESQFAVSVLEVIAHIIRNPQRLNKYEYTDSDQRKLNEVQLGVLKSSQLLKRMKDLEGTQISDEAIKPFWLVRLPDNVRAIEPIVDGDSARVSLQADKILEAQRHSAVCALQKDTNDGKLQAEIDQLRKEMRKLKLRCGNRARSNSKSPDRYLFCYYHSRFGAKARRCTEPCDFK
ncbi:uncharacterized protein [Drosophila virilis]|uniref:uncharacterized protein n=1 Tax=Drosophila virilis TaxID=7244 RepID=UPI0038B2D0D9